MTVFGCQANAEGEGGDGNDDFVFRESDESDSDESDEVGQSCTAWCSAVQG